MKKLSLTFIFIICIVIIAKAQKDDISKYIPERSPITYETITRFIQANATIGINSPIEFKTSLYSINKFFKGERVDLNDYYSSNLGRFYKNTEIKVGIKKEKSNDYNEMSFGFKYVIYNGRDNNIAKNYNEFNSKLAEMIKKNGELLNDEIEKIKNDNRLDSVEKSKRKTALVNSFTSYQKDHNIYFIPDCCKKNFQETVDKYKSILNDNEKKGLITLSGYSGYNFTNAEKPTSFLMLQYLKGKEIINNKPLDIDFQMKYQWERDSSIIEPNLSREILSSTLGVNDIIVIKDTKNDKKVEMEIAVEYVRLMNGTKPISGNGDITYFLAKVRVHLSDEITLPITVKYDPDHSNFLGVFQVQYNLQTKSK